MHWTVEDAQHLARTFVGALVRRDYDAAYDLTAFEYRGNIDRDKLREAYEAIVPAGHPVARIEVVETLEDWPARQPRDVSWLYVSLAGDAVAQGLAVVVTAEEETLRVRKVEWGCP